MVEPLALSGALVLAGLAGLGLVRAVRLRRLITTLRTISPKTIEGSEPGFVMVRGRISADPPLRSPFQHRSCVYYFFRVEEPVPGQRRPRRLATGKDWAEVTLDDGTAKCRVVARAAAVASTHSHEHEFRDLRAIPPEHAAFFEAAGIDPKHLARFPVLRVVEHTIEPGDEVYVTGTLRLEGETKVFYRAPRSPLIVSEGRGTGLLPGLEHELLLFSVAPVLLFAFAILFLVVALA